MITKIIRQLLFLLYPKKIYEILQNRKTELIILFNYSILSLNYSENIEDLWTRTFAISLEKNSVVIWNSNVSLPVFLLFWIFQGVIGACTPCTNIGTNGIFEFFCFSFCENFWKWFSGCFWSCLYNFKYVF